MSGSHFATSDGSVSVVLAEDDPQMRAMLAHGLRRCGYTIIEARDGNELAAILDTFLGAGHPEPHVDIIVTDVRMPGPSGLDALARVRAQDRALPMILMTAFGGPELHAEARRLGASAVFDKPFDVNDLWSAVVKHVGP